VPLLAVGTIAAPRLASAATPVIPSETLQLAPIHLPVREGREIRQAHIVGARQSELHTGSVRAAAFSVLAFASIVASVAKRRSSHGVLIAGGHVVRPGMPSARRSDDHGEVAVQRGQPLWAERKYNKKGQILTHGRRLKGKFLRPIASIANPKLGKRRPSADNILLCTGMQDLIEHYDAFMLDQFGVLHNGETAYPGVAECLEHLHVAGKPCVIVSNYAGRSDMQHKKLPQLGLKAEHVAGVVTSGELAHSYLSRHREKLGTRVLWISWAADNDRGIGSFFDDLEGYTLVSDAAEADFIFVSGVEALFAGTGSEVITNFERDGLRVPFTKTLRTGIQRRLPMLCANPDKQAVRPGGWIAHLPGLLAKQYEDLGGRVIYFGKPHTAAFEQARQILDDACARGIDTDDVDGGEPLQPLRICHVGDSLVHDVNGAHLNGLDSAFVVSTGIHAQDLSDELTVERVDKFCQQQDDLAAPTVVLPQFRW